MAFFFFEGLSYTLAMSPSAQLIDDITASIPGLKSLGMRKLALFGSYARGEQRPDSDVDLLAEIDAPSFDSYMDAKFMLEDRLKRRVDLVLAHTLKPALRDRILSELVNVPGF